MKTFKEKIKDILSDYRFQDNFRTYTDAEIREQILSACKQLIEEAKPLRLDGVDQYELGYNGGLKYFEQNLLKALGEKEK